MLSIDETFATMNDSTGSSNDICFIDGYETRLINVPDMYKELGVVSDENVNRIRFACPRIVGDNVDLTKYNIYINYRNAAGELNSYLVEDVDFLQETNENMITFSWLLSRHVTAAPGIVQYIVCAKKSDGVNTTNEWNTKVAIGTVIANDIEPVNEIEEQNADIIEQILTRIDVLENGSGSNISLGITSSEVGQFARVKTVDDTGKPTSWETSSEVGSEDIPTKVSQLENDLGFITENKTLAEYAKKVDVPSKSSVDSIISVLGIENKSELATADGISSVSLSDLNSNMASITLQSDNLILLPYDNNFSNTAQNEDDTVTSNGVTFKSNDDGSISIWGTATASTQYHLRNYYLSASNTSRFKLPAGTYTIGLYSDTGTVGSAVRIICNRYTSAAIYENHPATFTVADDQINTLTAISIQATTNVKDVTSENPIIVYPMLNEGDTLKPFNTPKKRLPTEQNSYIPDTICEVKKDDVIENITLNDTIASINTEGIKKLNVTSPLKYKITVTASVDSTESDSTLLKDLKILETRSFGAAPKNISVATLNNGEEIFIEESMSKKDKILVFFGSVSTMGTIKFYHGVNVYNSGRVEINSTNVKVVTYNTEDTVRKDVAHNLTITDYIGVIFDVGNSNDLYITVLTNGGSFELGPVWWGSSNGEIKIISEDSVLSNISVSWNCESFRSPIWIYGDSYLDSSNPARWPYHIINWDMDTFAMFGFPGAKSEHVYPEWLRTLKHGSPKYAIWCLGMNDIDDDTSINADWKKYIDNFIKDCTDNQIEPILATIPNTPERRHTFKNNYIRGSGYRYIDFAKAVNAETYPSNWYTGMLHSDNTHPSEQGAIALAIRALTDFPELTQG